VLARCEMGLAGMEGFERKCLFHLEMRRAEFEESPYSVRVHGSQGWIERMGCGDFELRAILTCSISAWVSIAAVIGLLAGSDVAVARIGRCFASPLAPADESLLIEAARRVLPSGIEPVVSGACVMPNTASAEITTQKFLDHPGVTHWWDASCQRDARDWICLRPELEQEVEQRLIVDGITRRVVISIDAATELRSAESLAIRALGIYANENWVLPYCGGLKGGEPRWQIERKKHPLPQGEDIIHVTVRAPPTIGTVLIDNIIQPDDFKFEIWLQAVGPDKHDPWYPCWMAMAP
jgi:hypothetical protein